MSEAYHMDGDVLVGPGGVRCGRIPDTKLAAQSVAWLNQVAAGRKPRPFAPCNQPAVAPAWCVRPEHHGDASGQ